MKPRDTSLRGHCRLLRYRSGWKRGGRGLTPDRCLSQRNGLNWALHRIALAFPQPIEMTTGAVDRDNLVVAPWVDRVDGDAIDQAGFQGSHVVDGFQNGIRDGGTPFHIKN